MPERPIRTMTWFTHELLWGRLPLTKEERAALELAVASMLDRDEDARNVLAKYNVQFNERGRAL